MTDGDIIARLEGRFGAFRLDARFSVPASGVTGLVGRSGAGKTTLLRCLAGLDRASGALSVRGEVWQDDVRFLPPHRRGVGYVSQHASLFGHLSVWSNLRYGLSRSKARDGLSFDEVVGLFGLEPLLSRSPARLSGGERQRAAIARARRSRPRLMLMDEPTAALDADAREELLFYLERLAPRLDLPIFYVAHDALEIERLADRVLMIREGCVAPVDRAAARAAAEARLDAMTPEQVRTLASSALLGRLA